MASYNAAADWMELRFIFHHLLLGFTATKDYFIFCQIASGTLKSAELSVSASRFQVFLCILAVGRVLRVLFCSFCVGNFIIKSCVPWNDFS